jgi:hypothetical protein
MSRYNPYGRDRLRSLVFRTYESKLAAELYLRYTNLVKGGFSLTKEGGDGGESLSQPKKNLDTHSWRVLMNEQSFIN